MTRRLSSFRILWYNLLMARRRGEFGVQSLKCG